MEWLKSLKQKRHKAKMQKIEKLRTKNDKLRSAGKEPLKGWNTMVNTGVGGLNNVSVKTGSGVVGVSHTKDDIANVFSTEQKALAETLEKRHIKQE